MPTVQIWMWTIGLKVCDVVFHNTTQYKYICKTHKHFFLIYQNQFSLLVYELSYHPVRNVGENPLCVGIKAQLILNCETKTTQSEYALFALESTEKKPIEIYILFCYSLKNLVPIMNFLWLLFTGVAVLLVFLYRWVTKNNDYFKLRGIPSNRPTFLLGSTGAFFLGRYRPDEYLQSLYKSFPNEK